MSDAEDADLLKRTRDALAGIVGKTPPGIGGWSFDRTHDFKVATEKARGVLSRRNSTIEALQKAYSALGRFYE